VSCPAFRAGRRLVDRCHVCLAGTGGLAYSRDSLEDPALKNRFTASCALFLSALFACGALAQAPSVTVSDAWVRVTPGSDVAAVYLMVRNTGTSAVTIAGVESPVADAMIHESTVEGGVSRMRPQGALIVAPGQTLKFEPGGLHVMLHGLKHALSPGDSVPVVLRLKSGGSLSFQARVRPLNAP